MADPTSENKLANKVNDIISAIIEDGGEPEVEALILGASASVLAIPFIGFIYKVFVHIVVQKFGKFFYLVAAKIATRIVVDNQVNSEVMSAKDHFQNLQMALASGDPDAIDVASKNLTDAYVALGHSDGWATNIK